MRIKRLVIRNIASIESGDIDFEKGLTDPFSGENASLFLISGDTGSGKSAILDCISLALYGTTPRVVGVNGVRSNKYTVGDKAISVSDVRQYTRLGIGAKDECYARLTFTGNDEVEYISTFHLGMTTHGNLAKVRWTLEIAGETTLEQEKNVAPRILEAIGLTYDQFSRMAMLAQGQFASFLVGGKEERERILEQLTSTQRFSDYGKAISLIYKRKRQTKDLLENQLAAEGKHILPPEEELRLTEKIRHDRKIIESMRGQLALIDRILELRKAIVASSEAMKDAEEKLGEVEKERSSEDFKFKTETIRLWDATSHLRSLTAELTRSAQKLESKSALLRKYLYRDEEHKTATKFSQEDNILETICKETTGLAGEKIRAYESRLNHLNRELASVLGDKGLAELRKQSGILRDSVKDMDNLVKDLDKLAQDKENLDKAEKNERRLASVVDGIEKERDIAVQTLAEAKKNSEEAYRRYTTMHLSLSENFTALRKRLHEEDAAHCPLCGQGVDSSSHWMIDGSAFTAILSPLEAERREASEKLAKIEAEHNLILESLNKSKGELKALSDQNRKKERELEKIRKDCLSRLCAYGIPNLDFDRNQLDAIKTRTLEEEKELEKTMAGAEDLQKEISRLQAKEEPAIARLRSESAVIDNLLKSHLGTANERKVALDEIGLTDEELRHIIEAEKDIPAFRNDIATAERKVASLTSLHDVEKQRLEKARTSLSEIASPGAAEDHPEGPVTVALAPTDTPLAELEEKRTILQTQTDALLKEYGTDSANLDRNRANKKRYDQLIKEVESQREEYLRWNKLNSYFGGSRFRTLVQSYILKPLLANANRYLERITDHFTLTCSEENEQLAILVLDRYNKNQMRSATILSGGERFMISLALSLALSSLNKPDMNVDILFIDEGFGTLDSASLNSVIDTLRRLPEIAGQNGRRVGVISHREELADEIGVKIKVERCGEGRSRIKIEK